MGGRESHGRRNDVGRGRDKLRKGRGEQQGSRNKDNKRIYRKKGVRIEF